MAILVISFDGVGDQAFEAMANDPVTYPNIARFKSQSIYRGGVRTMFVSNTYPIHASISTGKLPREHGVISNYIYDETGGYRWAQLARHIKTETIWDAAYQKGLTTAAILWPITCGAANIQWNLPEVHLEGGQKQLRESLRHGSKCFQLGAFLRHGTKLGRGVPQPGLDRFSTAVTCDVLRQKRPDLTLLHLIAYDTIRHKVGSEGELLQTARTSLDENLGKLLDAAGDMTVLIFGDHAHLDVSEEVDLTSLFGDAVLEQCGGSAFLACTVANLDVYPWFGRFLTAAELDESGYAAQGAVCGVAPKPGYTFDIHPYKSNHGYPADYAGYQVFYALRGQGPLPEPRYGDLRDLTAIIASELCLDMD
ncbi:MAG: ectonucleotide pyrophosphatase/phosphodiesterase [Oscillospiraceae bacterium]|nr:ectonucleotide pyrophosphatase/phosphodiesterase [Oscillospiraceae bacterium]